MLTLYPFLFAAYPILLLLSNNILQVEPQDAIRSVVVSFLIVGTLFVIFRFLLRSGHQAALLTTLLTVFFFSYGHIYSSLKSIQVVGFILGRHRYLIPMYLFVFVLLVLVIFKGKFDKKLISQGMLVIGISLVAFPIFNLGKFTVSSVSNSVWEETSAQLPQRLGSNIQKRDVYYIILDEYGREDTLLDVFEFNNREFLNKLEGMGFYVASESRSNYSQTELSLTSSLNLDYLNNLGLDVSQDLNNRIMLRPYLRNSRVRSYLEQEGYSVLAFETGYYWTEFKDADIFFQRSNKGLGNQLVAGANSFEVLLLRSTLVSALMDSLTNFQSKLTPLQEQQNRNHYERILYVLDTLEDVPDLPRPKFVFVHLVSPHPPYVFNTDGSYKSKDEIDPEQSEFEQYREDYLDQVKYLNSRLIPILDSIFEKSEVEPIIIIQSDTGPKEVSTVQRMRILNAIYFPEYNMDDFWASISPINTFRVLMNTYFDGEFEQLEDASYFSTYEYPFQFEKIP